LADTGGSATAISLSANQTLLAVNQSAVITVTVYADAAQTIPLANAPLSATVSGSASIDNLPTRTGSNGQAQFSVSNTVGENVVLTVQSDGMTQSLGLYFGAKLTLLPQNSNAIQSTQLTALLKDANGTPLSSQKIEFGFIGNNNKTLSPVIAQTDEQGTAQVTITDLGNESGLTTVQARSGGVETQANINFLAVLNDGQTLNVEPAVVLRPVNQTVTLNASITDATGTPVTGKALTFSTTGNARFGNGRAQTTVTTNIEGKSSAVLSNSSAENVSVTISAGITTKTVQVYFGAGIKLVPGLQDGSADGSTPVTLTAHVTDANNRGIAGIPIQFRSMNGNALLDTFNGISDERGLAEVSVTNTRIEQVQVEAQVENFGTAYSTVNFIALSQLEITASSILMPTGQSTEVLVKVKRQDSNKGLANAPFSVTTSGSATVLNQPSTTDETGVARFQIADTIAENVSVTVKSGDSSQTLTLYFGAQVQLAVKDNFQRADGESDITLSVIVRDAHNVPISNIPVSLSTSSRNVLLGTYQGVTGNNGVLTTYAESSVAGDSNISASAEGISSETVTVTFITAPAQLLAQANYSILPVGGVASIRVQTLSSEATQTRVSYWDEALQVWTVETSIDATDVRPDIPFTINLSGSAQILEQPSPLRTNANGIAELKITNTKSENVTLTVNSGSQSHSIPLYFGAKLSLLPHNSNAIQSAELTALLKDGTGKPLENKTVEFRFLDQNNNTLTPANAQTDEQGTAQTTVIDLANEGNISNVQARSGLVEANTNINFLVTLAGGRTLDVAPSVALAPVNVPLTLTATVEDSTGTPVSGIPISFSSTGAAQLSGVSAETNDEGKAFVTITDGTAENVTLTVAVGTTKKEVKIYFGASVKLLPATSDGSAGGVKATVLTANVVDGANRGIAGVPVLFRSTGGSALLSTFQGLTNAQGLTEVNLTNTEIETTVVEAAVSGLNSASATVNFSTLNTNSADKILLSSEPDNATLSLNGKAVIIAKVLDSSNQAVQDGTEVRFNTTVGQIPQVAFTKNGETRVTFSAGTSTGIAAITASVSSSVVIDGVLINRPVEAGLSVLIEASDIVGSIEIVSITPDAIGITGSGTTQTSRIQFMVRDPAGNPIKDDSIVTFSLGDTRLGGGESLSSGSQTGTSVTNATVGGIVEVIVKSGNVAGPIDVIATIDNISTVAQVSVVGGLPDAKHFGLAAETLSIEGFIFGLQNQITAYVGDRYGNIVPDGTRVNFISEGGLIGTSQASGAFTSTTEFGQAGAILQTAEPSDDLSGVFPPGNSGLNTIVAYTTGSESFNDQNGNGIFDGNDTITHDMSEPYIDANNSGAWELGELFIDVNGNGAFDKADGVFQSNTTIWTDMDIIFSKRATQNSIQIEPSSFNICQRVNPNVSPPEYKETVATITVTASDSAGNPLAAGTQIDVSPVKLQTDGTTTLTVPSSLNIEPFSFEVSNLEQPTCGNNQSLKTSDASGSTIVKVTMSDGSVASNSIQGTVCQYTCE
jgi:adhesin/invasin